MIAHSINSLIKTLILGLVCLACGGCARVVFRQPVGGEVEPAKVSEFLGRWTGPKGMTVTVTEVKEQPFLLARWKDDHDGTDTTFRVQVRRLESGQHLIWAEQQEGYLPMRVSGDAEELVLFPPDEKAVERLVVEKKLAGAFDKSAGVWRIFPGDGAKVLEGKEFWDLDGCLPLVKAKADTLEPPSTEPSK